MTLPTFREIGALLPMMLPAIGGLWILCLVALQRQRDVRWPAAHAVIFLGLSAAGVLTPEMVKTMARDPLILALANPDPEITYEDARAARSDALVATGRSDYPNQVNNVLGFPFIFRGALDVRARGVSETMKVAAARALAELAREPVPESVLRVDG